VPLDQLVLFDALAAVAVVHGHHMASQAAEDRRRLLRRFATGELDLDAYQCATAALSAHQAAPADGPLVRRLTVGRSPSR
jgi:hypothetical protein